MQFVLVNMMQCIKHTVGKDQIKFVDFSKMVSSCKYLAGFNLYNIYV
jgi:hypothetical protein